MSERKCPSCGATIDLVANECKYCGESVGNQNPQQTQYQQPAPQQGNNYSGNNYVQNVYSSMKPYYQHEFNKISSSNGTYKGKWNWCAFFFSWIWALTKGLWGLALAAIGVDIILAALDISWLAIGIAIFFGVRGNYFYYNLITNNTQFPQKV